MNCKCFEIKHTEACLMICESCGEETFVIYVGTDHKKRCCDCHDEYHGLKENDISDKKTDETTR